MIRMIFSTVRAPQLPALTVDDSHDYLRHQIKMVGGRPEAVFDDEAVMAELHDIAVAGFILALVVALLWAL